MHRRLSITIKVEGTDKETRHSFEYRKQGEVEAEMDLTDTPHQFVVNRLVGLLEAVAIAADHVWPSTETDMTDDFREADAMLTATPVPLVETPVGDTIETAGEQDAGERELEF